MSVVFLCLQHVAGTIAFLEWFAILQPFCVGFAVLFGSLSETSLGTLEALGFTVAAFWNTGCLWGFVFSEFGIPVGVGLRTEPISMTSNFGVVLGRACKYLVHMWTRI